MLPSIKHHSRCYKGRTNHMKITQNLVVMAALLVLCNFSSAETKTDLSVDMLKRLEVNTFRNSFRARDYPDGTTVEQTPYNIFSTENGSPNIANATDKNETWIYSLEVIDGAGLETTVCFVDQNLHGTYFAATELLLKKNSKGNYIVVREVGASERCSISKS